MLRKKKISFSSCLAALQHIVSLHVEQPPLYSACAKRPTDACHLSNAVSPAFAAILSRPLLTTVCADCRRDCHSLMTASCLVGRVEEEAQLQMSSSTQNRWRIILEEIKLTEVLSTEESHYLPRVQSNQMGCYHLKNSLSSIANENRPRKTDIKMPTK